MARRQNTPNYPQSLDSERFILGSILLDGTKFTECSGAITPDVFMLEKHRTIWKRMCDLAERGDVIDRMTVANELMRHGEYEAIGGMTFLISLDEGIPNVANIRSWVGIVVEKWRLRKAALAAQNIYNRAMSGEFTADQVSLEGQASLAEQTSGYGTSQIESVNEFVESYPGGINLLLDPMRADRGISTGFRDLDAITGGFHAGEIFMVGARPASGKTAIGSNVAKSVAREGHAVAVFTLELSKTMFLQRMICEEARVAFSRFRRGEIDDDARRRVRAATSAIMDMPIYIDDTSSLSVADMRVKINRIVAQRPLSLIVCDYAQLLKPPKGIRFSTENDKFTAIGEGIKHLCKETRIPMLLLSQLNRDSEKDKGDSRPKLSQCRGAGIWEEISFVGACLYREWLKKREREDLRDKAELLIEKNRSGPSRNVNLRFQGWLMRFSDSLEEPTAQVEE